MPCSRIENDILQARNIRPAFLNHGSLWFFGTFVQRGRIKNARFYTVQRTEGLQVFSPIQCRFSGEPQTKQAPNIQRSLGTPGGYENIPHISPWMVFRRSNDNQRLISGRAVENGSPQFPLVLLVFARAIIIRCSMFLSLRRVATSIYLITIVYWNDLPYEPLLSQPPHHIWRKTTNNKIQIQKTWVFYCRKCGLGVLVVYSIQ